MFVTKRLLGGIVGVALVAASAEAQVIGTFRWQTAPFCNVVTLTVTQQSGGVFTLDGFDDQCGASTRAAASGTAVPNPDGSIALGLTIVSAPEALPLHLTVPVSLATLGGTWRDSAGQSGPFRFTPGPSSGGARRPLTTTPEPVRLPTTPDGTLDLSNARGLVALAPPIGLRLPAGSLRWLTLKRALRAGIAEGAEWDDANVGTGSVAFGFNTIASGFGAVATGDRSTALGDSSVAQGQAARATGSAAVALGAHVTATGAASVALGLNAVANAAGSFVFGDTSTSATGANVESGLPNQFLVRAAGGTVFWSTAETVFPTSPGVTLFHGESAWSSLSDVHAKEHFRDLDGDAVLAKLARMPIREWSFKAHEGAIRHVGPTAQDFHAAFGLGQDERRISTIDADGIALRAIQALEARTRALLDENRALRDELAEVRQLLGAKR